MPKKEVTSRSEPPAKNADKLRRLSPRPDTDKPARPQSPHWHTGSWRGKAPAVSGLAPDHATISMTSDDKLHKRTTSTSSTSSSPSLRLVRTLTTPGKSGLSTATPTKLSITANSRGETVDSVCADDSTSSKNEDHTDVLTSSKNEDHTPVTNTNDEAHESKAHEVNPETRRVSSWGGWFAKSNAEEPQKPASEAVSQVSNHQGQTQPSTTSHQDIPAESSISTAAQTPDQVPLPQTSDTDLQDENTEELNGNCRRNERPRSWFDLWTGAESQHTLPEVAGQGQLEETGQVDKRDSQLPKAAFDTKASTAESQPTQPVVSRQDQGSWFGSWGRTTPRKPPISEPAGNQTHSPERYFASVAVESASPGPGSTGGLPASPKSASSSSRLSGYTAWGLWSRGTQQPPSNSSAAAEAEQGELVIAPDATQSQSKPLPVTITLEDTLEASTTTRTPEDNAPASTHNSAIASEESGPGAPMSQSGSPSHSSATPTKKESMIKVSNLVVPQVHDTHKAIRQPGQQPQTYTQQVYGWLGRGSPAMEAKDEGRLAAEPPRIKRALVLGVHGLLPGAWFQKVFGPPTGTSVRFAAGAAAAVETWCSARGYTCEIEKVALEGEGMIVDRVEALWKLLLNWSDHIKKADLVLFAAHSQGVPVSVMLMARLLDGGYLGPEVRAGILGMAGVSLGPFSSLPSRFMAPAGSVAGELFEFSSPKSTVSTEYANALRVCLGHHPNAVRLTLVGSIDDQLVSLESSLFTTLTHPMIYRAAFVDGRIHAPGFLTHLVAFACKVRNLLGTDHGLLRELSTPLAGSLYGGEGHSMIYKEQEVYNVAMSWTLESLESEMAVDPVLQHDYEPPTNNNPFFLPWAARGLLEEEIVRTQLQDEAKELLKQFDDWQPTTKVLKDVKFRLEAVKTKL